MKNKVAIFAIIIFVFLGQFANAQTYIANQVVFDAMFAAAPAGEITFEDGAGVFPYIFGVNDPLEDPPLVEDVEFTIDAGEILRIDPDTEVQFAAEVILIVEGEIIDSEEPGLGDEKLFTRFVDGQNEDDAWQCIRINGNDNDPDDEDGIIELTQARFEGGGWGPDPDEGECDWRGLIVLAAFEDEAEAVDLNGHPVLILTDCFLQRSEHNGIVVESILDCDLATIVLTRCGIGNEDEGDEEDPDMRILDNGIKIGDEEEPLIWDIECSFTSTDTWVRWCGANGFYCFDGAGFTDNLDIDYLFESSDPTNILSNYSDNGTEVDGCGIFFINPHEEECDANPDPYTVIEIIDTNVEENTWDGIRFKDNEATVNIHRNEVHENAERGIYFDFACLSGLVHIYNNYVWNNGWEGIATFKGNNQYVAIYIRGNLVESNAFVGEANLRADANWLANWQRCANIRIHGQFGSSEIIPGDDWGLLEQEWTMICNNTIIDGITGMSIEDLSEAEGENAMDPRWVSVHNNIQYGAQEDGLRLEDYWNGEGDVPGVLIYNNNFCNNGSDGIWISARVPGEDDDDFGAKIKNNILFNNTDDGIDNDSDDQDVVFSHNGFDDNGTNMEGCLAFEPILMDPLFVDAVDDLDGVDFHLRWDSPMINRGAVGDDLWDPDGDENFRNFADDDNPHPFDENIVQRDGSRNDIGAYGGFGAVDGGFRVLLDEEEWEPYEWNFDPYCAINADCDELCNDNLPVDPVDTGTKVFLEWDYYRASVSFSVENGEVLFIGPGDQQGDDTDMDGAQFGNGDDDDQTAYFEIEDNLTFKIDGEIQCNGVNNGNNDEIITFTSWGEWVEGTWVGDIWSKMKFTLLSEVGSNMSFTDISRAYTGVYFGLVPNDGDEQIELVNCVISNCQNYGVDIYDSRVEMSGEALNRNEISDIAEDGQTPSHIETGLKISSCDDEGPGMGEQDVEIVHTLITGCGYAEEDAIWKSGVECGSTDALFDDVTITENGTVGMYLWSCDANLEIIATGDAAADIFNNGQDFDPQGGIDGSEIYLGWATNGTFESIDLYEEEATPGILVYKSETNQNNMITLTDCFFGEDLDPIPPAGWPDAWFFYNPLDVFGDHFTLANPVDDEIDNNVRSYDYAKDLLENGEAQQALEISEWLIEYEPESSDAISCVRYLFKCYEALDMDLNDLRRYYASVESDNRGETIGRVSNLMIPKTLVRERRFEDASRAFASIIDNPADEIEGTMASIHELELANALGELDEIDSGGNYHLARSNLIGKLDRLGREKSKKTVPTEFSIISAYPNPFNSTVLIGYDVGRESEVNLSVFDVSGRMVENLYHGNAVPGTYKTSWQAPNMPTGVYMVRLETIEGVKSTKLMLIK
ncbi:MAG: T9SS type A sorting domain-containing protein [Calditrichaeota bacterium]|jgi:hypothetical protein|nr:T9SS type A sorting domain-containing protein [Calditrichota bacterium]MBT7618677.1 T9SS type A sorting domain-containing protein [Calditrichota bacterium]MBT7789517.1 T9SS type A sorting domain-containing protein [Calditrichota bacterium]